MYPLLTTILLELPSEINIVQKGKPLECKKYKNQPGYKQNCDFFFTKPFLDIKFILHLTKNKMTLWENQKM